jgi:S1-C subfamily serine protease
VAGSVSLSVNLHGELQPVAATVVGTDPSQDIALIRLIDPPAGLEPVIFGDSDGLVVGDAVVAIGDALGLSAGTPTVTSGIVSALGRTVAQVQTASSTAPGSDDPLVDMIQTDAPINPGNSGGPLLNSEGQVIGMNTDVASSNADNTPAQDIGFAIPSERLVGALTSLEKGGQAEKALLGVEAISNTPELKSQYGLAVTTGAVVVAVDSDSSAYAAGVRVGDVIVSFNQKTVSSSEDLQDDIASGSVGEKVTLEIWRQKRKMTLVATLESETAAG